MLNFFLVITIAISLSMDTFSLSIIYGIIGVELRKQYILSIIVGMYHFIMPLLGNLIGNEIFKASIIKTDILIGIIFIIIAIEMIFQKEGVSELKKIGAFLLFGLTVSIDSFSVGLGLSGISNNQVMSCLIFSLVSGIFTFLGLKFGNRLGEKFGIKAKNIGAIILIIIGVCYIV